MLAVENKSVVGFVLGPVGSSEGLGCRRLAIEVVRARRLRLGLGNIADVARGDMTSLIAMSSSLSCVRTISLAR